MIRRFFAFVALASLSGCITTEQAIDAGKQIVTDRISAARQPAPAFVTAVTNNYAIDEGRWITGRVMAVRSQHAYFEPVGAAAAPQPAPQPVPAPPPPPPPVPDPQLFPLNGPMTGSIVQ